MDVMMAQSQKASIPRSGAVSRPDHLSLPLPTALERSPRTHALGCDVASGVVAIDVRLNAAAAIAVEHFALELALWHQLDARPEIAVRVAHALAAAQATAAFIELHPLREAERLLADLPVALARLMAAAKKQLFPGDLAAVVNETDIAEGAALAASDAWTIFTQLRPFALPVQALMLEAGDNRLSLDPESGCNRYGGSPFPRPDVAEFSSSTATDLSSLALSEAEAQRRTLMRAAVQGDVRRATRAAAAEIKTELLQVLGIDNNGSVVPVLAASGTTAILFATHMALGGDGRPALALVVGPEETGRGVPAAVVGRHAAPCAPTGVEVEQNGEIAGLPSGMKIERLAVRNAQGRPVPPDSLAEPIAGILAREQAAGRRVILYVIEGSKTGLVAPGIASVLLLRRWFPDLPIVVDACQLRTGAAVLRRYLAAGCMVVVTGSKFFGGPPFSGALLAPTRVFETMGTMPAGFADYSWRADWPAELEDADKRFAILPETSNAGLLLRWRGALAEMMAFGMLPAAKVANLLDEIGRNVRSVLLASANATPLAAMPAASADSESWASRPSIFTFALRNDDGAWLDEAALRRLHLQLASDVSDCLPSNATPERRRLAARICHIGQPVGFAGGPYPAALRIAIGSRRIVAAIRPGGLETLRHDLDDVMAKLELLLRLPN